MPRQIKPWFRKACGRWYYTVNGQQKPLEATDPRDFAGAMREVASELAALKQTVQADPDAPVVRGGAIRALYREYLPVLARRVQADTVENYGRYLTWFVGRFGDLGVNQLRAADVEDAAAAEGWSDNTRRTCLSVIRGFVRWCGRTNFRLKYPAVERRGAEVLVSPAEFDQLLSDARGDFGPLLRFWWLTGCRPGEARGLTVSSVDWASGTITLRQHKTRGKGKERVIVLCQESLAVLTEQRVKYAGGLLFRDRYGGQFSRGAVKQRMRRLRKRVGVKDDVICYSFRHTLATRALEAGASDSDVAAILGHSSTQMIHKHYSHLTANTRRLKGVLSQVNGQSQG